jgi:hypothetical protein
MVAPTLLTSTAVGAVKVPQTLLLPAGYLRIT